MITLPIGTAKGFTRCCIYRTKAPKRDTTPKIIDPSLKKSAITLVGPKSSPATSPIPVIGFARATHGNHKITIAIM